MSIREISVQPSFLENADGSVLYSSGRTRVLCAATIEAGAPPWRGDKLGWLTAEYSMLPYSTRPRNSRDRDGVPGRTREIQRLIGRALRASLDFARIPGYTIRIDCDVVAADGGTRTAAISGGSIALGLAIQRALEDGRFMEDPRIALIVAISAGIVKGEAVLDLDYVNDSAADLDLNIVGTPSGELVEIQGSSESTPIAIERWGELIELARDGLREVGDVVTQHTPSF